MSYARYDDNDGDNDDNNDIMMMIMIMNPLTVEDIKVEYMILKICAFSFDKKTIKIVATISKVKVKQ